MSELAFSVERYRVPGGHPPPVELVRCLRCGRGARVLGAHAARWVDAHATAHLRDALQSGRPVGARDEHEPPEGDAGGS